MKKLGHDELAGEPNGTMDGIPRARRPRGQGATMRIEELERQRDLMSNAVGHVNRRYQETTEEYVHAVSGIEEASHAPHHRDELTAELLHQELGQLRSQATQRSANLGTFGEGRGEQHHPCSGIWSLCFTEQAEQGRDRQA